MSSRLAERHIVVLQARGVSFRYDNEEILHEVDLDLRRGELLAVQGRSGTGKSTLLHCLAGLLDPDSGEVLFEGRRINGLPDRLRCRIRLQAFGFLFQFGDMLPELDVVENVELPLRLLGQSKRAARDQAVVCLGRLGIANLASRHLSQVSGGELQRAALARAIVHQPKVLFADEPTGALDDDNARTVMDLLVDLARTDKLGVLVVTHDRDVATRSDRVFRLGERSPLASAGR